MTARATGALAAPATSALMLAVAALVATSASATPAGIHADTAATRADAAATRAYIYADYALVHAAKVNLKTSEADLQKLRRQIARDCSGAAGGSPQDRDSEQLSNELVGAMTVTAIGPDRPAVAAFARTVARLRWSSGALTHKVHEYATRLRTLGRLRAPDVCADVRMWAANGFQTLPASSVAFDTRYSKVEVAVGEVPAQLLAPSEQPAERAILARAQQIEGQLTEAEANAVYTWGQIMESLKLNP